jgi:hypothetical protein
VSEVAGDRSGDSRTQLYRLHVSTTELIMNKEALCAGMMYQHQLQGSTQQAVEGSCNAVRSNRMRKLVTA